MLQWRYPRCFFSFIFFEIYEHFKLHFYMASWLAKSEENTGCKKSHWTNLNTLQKIFTKMNSIENIFCHFLRFRCFCSVYTTFLGREPKIVETRRYRNLYSKQCGIALILVSTPELWHHHALVTRGESGDEGGRDATHVLLYNFTNCKNI